MDITPEAVDLMSGVDTALVTGALICGMETPPEAVPVICGVDVTP